MGDVASEYLSVIQAAVRLGASVTLVRRWCQSGKIPAIKSGKTWIIKEEDLANAPPKGKQVKSRSKAAQ